MRKQCYRQMKGLMDGRIDRIEFIRPFNGVGKYFELRNRY